MKQLISSLIKFQQQVPTIPKGSFNPHFKSYFADLATVVDVCKPVLNKNGLCIAQKLGTLEGKNVLTTTLYHESGESIDASIYLPEIPDAQKLTAAITYLRRTSYLSILGLVADVDSDGNDVPGTAPYKAQEHTTIIPNDKMAPYEHRPKTQPSKPSFKLDDNKDTPGQITDNQKRAVAAIANKHGIDKPDLNTFDEAREWITKMNSKG